MSVKKIKKLILALLVFGTVFPTSAKPVQAVIYSINSADQQIYQDINGQKCGFFTGCAVAGQDVQINLNGLTLSDGSPLPDGTPISAKWVGKGGGCIDYYVSAGGPMDPVVTNQSLSFTIPKSYVASQCTYSLQLSYQSMVKTYELNTPSSQPVQASCSAEQCNSEDLGTSESSTYELCAQIDQSKPQYQACMSCFTGEGIWTAVGCIPSDPESIIQTVITIGLSVGGGVVLIMILAGSFMLSVSQGDPNKTKEAKEIITSAIIGLIFVIFSVTILQFIGVSILHIPGFGE